MGVIRAVLAGAAVAAGILWIIYPRAAIRVEGVIQYGVAERHAIALGRVIGAAALFVGVMAAITYVDRQWWIEWAVATGLGLAFGHRFARRAASRQEPV